MRTRRKTKRLEVVPIPEHIRELESIFAEANQHDFATVAEEEAWLAERGVTFEPCTGAFCARCRILYSSDYEPGVRYGEPLKAPCIQCGGPMTRGA